MMRVPVYFKSYTKHTLKDTCILLTNILTKPASNAIILFHSFVVPPPLSDRSVTCLCTYLVNITKKMYYTGPGRGVGRIKMITTLYGE